MSTREKERERDRDRDRDRDRERGDREESKKTDGSQKEKDTKDDSFSEFQKALEMHNNAKKRKDTKPEPKLDATKGANLISQTSLEAAAKKQKADEVTTKKPVFLSKKDREKAALAKLEDKRKTEQKAKEELEKQRMEFELASRSRHQDRRREKDRELDRRKEEAEKKARNEQRNSLAVHKQQEKYLQVLKEAYLGKKKIKKTVIPPSQKFKFSFDWEPSEDTSIELNSLYDSKHKVALLYGRGFVGGVDRREQRKGNSFYDELIKNREDNDSTLLKDQEEALRRGDIEQQKKDDQAATTAHWSEKKLDQMQERDWQIFLEDFMISVRGNDVPKPLRYWKEARLPEEIQMALVTAGYREPTALQRQAIPVHLQGQDLICIAEHGAGRTAAFVIPVLCNVSKLPKLVSSDLRARGPYVVVLATKERVKAIHAEFSKFLKGHSSRCVALHEGATLGEIVSQVKEGAEIIIGTPEKVSEYLDKKLLAVVQCACVVLDQCSRLLASKPTEAQVTQILDAMPSNDPDAVQDPKSVKKNFVKIVRQTILYSAAMPPSMEALAKTYLRNPVFVAIGESSSSGQIKQKVSFLDDDKEKVAKLFLVLEEEEGPFLVFVNSKQTCERLAGVLKEKEIKAAVLHGSITEEERKASVDGFEKGEINVLVVSDRAEKATEGLTAVKHVVIFNIGTEIAKYAQRIARSVQASTGKGYASVLICEEDYHIFYDLKEFLKENGQPVPYRLNTHGASKNRTAAAAMDEL